MSRRELIVASRPRSDHVKLRNWIITINNPGAEDRGPDIQFPDWVSYATWQEEQGEEKGVHHTHIYVECARAVSFTSVKERFPRANIQGRKGTQKQAIDYVTKPATRTAGPWEFGQKKQQGQRTDLDELKADIIEGKRLPQIASDHFSNYIRYHRGIERSISLLRGGVVRPEFKIKIYWGPTGCGKTHRAWREFPNSIDIPDNAGGWMGDYADHESIIFDEFAQEGGRALFPKHLMLKLCSDQPCQQWIKGSQTWITANTVVFTSNYDPREWYGHDGGERSPWHRRLDQFAEITYLDVPYEAPADNVAPEAEGPDMGAIEEKAWANHLIAFPELAGARLQEEEDIPGPAGAGARSQIRIEELDTDDETDVD